MLYQPKENILYNIDNNMIKIQYNNIIICILNQERNIYILGILYNRYTNWRYY